MAIDYTTDALVAAIQRRGFLPVGTGLESADILAYATDELGSFIPAFLKSIREEFIISTLDIAAAGGVINAPVRAVGAALRTVGWLLSDGKVRFLPRVEPERAGGWTGQTGEPCGYMFQGNQLLLLPAPTSGTVRLAYQQRPGKLVAPSECGLVTAIDTGSLGVTVSTAHSSWQDDTPLDVVSGSPNFVALALDQVVTGAATTTLTFDNGLPVGMAVGDYVCLAGETPIPQLPTEVHDLLAQAAALAIANATGSQRLTAIQKKFDDVKTDTTMLLSPRSDGSARPIISRSRIGRWNMGW